MANSRSWKAFILNAGIDLATIPERVKRQFGYAVDPADLPPDLTGQQYLELIGSIRGCHPNAWPCFAQPAAVSACAAERNRKVA